MIVNFVCLYLDDLIKIYEMDKIKCQNNYLQNYDNKKRKFNGYSLYWCQSGDKIDLYQYCQHILKLTSHHEINLIYALILINRFLKKTYWDLNNNNIFRLILIGNLISSKILDDDFYNNITWSLFGKIDIFYLNKLELEFFFCLDGALNISCSELIETYKHIIGYLKYHNFIEDKKQIPLPISLNSSFNN